MTGRPAATVLAARKIWPDYVSGDSFRFLAMAGGRVTALAHTAAEAEAAAGPSADWVDLGAACVGPGFIDTHIHALQAAADVRLVNLREAASLDDLLAAVREAGLRRPPGRWTVSGRNWHESQLREGRLPTRADLDVLSLPGPVLLRRGSHLAVLNSRAAALLGEPAIGQTDSDALIARALGLAGRPTLDERCDDLAAVLARFNARGLTTIREAGVDAAELALFRALRDRGRLSMRCDLLWRVAEGSDADSARRQIAGLPPGGLPPGGPADGPELRLTGVKAFVDGRIADAAIGGHDAIGGRDAIDGHDGDGAGADAFRMSAADLWAVVEAALRRSAGVGCHAVGDRAVRMVLDAYERALSAGLAADPGRLVVEHALDCTPATIRRLAASRVGVSVHPAIVYEFAGDIRRYWGGGNRAAPVRDLVAAGVRVAAGSDGDVPPFDPLRGIWFMVTRQGRTGGPIGAGQAVARNVALDLYTRRGASLLGVGARRGQLRPGMDADLVAFCSDPLTCPAGDLPDIGIRLTLLGGKPVHDPGALMEGSGDG